MAHNITTKSDRRPGDSLLEGKIGAALPIEGDSVLVVKADARGLAGQVTFLFHQGNDLRSPSVVLHPWNTDDQQALAITGEDLYAFRELLNELPEEAFVRPKDPVEESRWTDGDIVKPGLHSTVTYIRRDGEWFRVSKGAVRPDDLHSDKVISELVDLAGYAVVLQQNA